MSPSGCFGDVGVRRADGVAVYGEGWGLRGSRLRGQRMDGEEELSGEQDSRSQKRDLGHPDPAMKR